MYHILVVDDEAKIREIIKKYAVFEGYRVTEAANGMEAIDLCRTEPFDLIIMDVMMPRAGRLFRLPRNPQIQPHAHHHAFRPRRRI